MELTPPAHSDRRTALQTVGEMALNLVPGIGGSLAVAITHRLNANLDRRRDAWFASLAATLEDLRMQVEGLDIEALADDDAFIDAVVTASRVAARTSQQEKLDAARNAVLNVALPGGPDEDEQHLFFGLIDDLTPTHLQMLDMISDPREFIFKRRGEKPQFVVTSRPDIVRTTMPELAARGADTVDRYFFDLQRHGLIEAGQASAHDPLRYRAAGPNSDDLSYRLTPWGMEFLAFIRDPRTGAAD